MELLLFPHRCSARPLIIKFPFFFFSRVSAFQNIFWCFKILLISFLLSSLLEAVAMHFSFTNGRDASAALHSPTASEYYSNRCRLLQCRGSKEDVKSVPKCTCEEIRCSQSVILIKFFVKLCWEWI